MNWTTMVLTLMWAALTFTLESNGIEITSITFWVIFFQVFVIGRITSRISIDAFRAEFEKIVEATRDKIFELMVESATREFKEATEKAVQGLTGEVEKTAA